MNCAFFVFVLYFGQGGIICQQAASPLKSFRISSFWGGCYDLTGQQWLIHQNVKLTDFNQDNFALSY
jgi:hypothetical protein